jgi:hypothetical protein
MTSSQVATTAGSPLLGDDFLVLVNSWREPSAV